MHARETQAEARARLDRTFAQELYDLANSLRDMPDETLTWVGTKVAELADRARFLDARSAEDFDEKTEAMRDSALDRWAGRCDSRGFGLPG